MEQRKRIFVFSGKQATGKSTYGDYLLNYIGKDRCKIFKFAEIIYKLHDVCLPILKEYEIVPKDVRKEGCLLQVLGSEYGRVHKGKNVWADVCKKEVDKYLAENSNNYAIIDDCRFENEFDYFHPVANMIRLTCPLEIRKARCSAWRDNDNHISETGLDAYEKAGNFDIIIDTRGTASNDPSSDIAYMLTDFGYLFKR